MVRNPLLSVICILQKLMLGKQKVPDISAKASFQNEADNVSCSCDQASEKTNCLH